MKLFSVIISSFFLSAAFTVGAKESAARSGQPEVSPLTADQQAEVREARKTHETIKAGSGADDILPEIYLYTVIQNYSMFDEMKQLVKTMQAKQPNNEAVRDLDAWVENRRQK